VIAVVQLLIVAYRSGHRRNALFTAYPSHRYPALRGLNVQSQAKYNQVDSMEFMMPFRA
jgi:hypothetical protein